MDLCWLSVNHYVKFYNTIKLKDFIDTTSDQYQVYIIK